MKSEMDFRRVWLLASLVLLVLVFAGAGSAEAQVIEGGGGGAVEEEEQYQEDNGIYCPPEYGVCSAEAGLWPFKKKKDPCKDKVGQAKCLCECQRDNEWAKENCNLLPAGRAECKLMADEVYWKCVELCSVDG